MISFGPTEEQDVVREAMREFSEQVLRPVARECDEEARLPDDVMQQVWELGLTSTQIPEAFGGGGEERSPITNSLVLEELAYGDVSLALAAVSPSLFACAVLDHGTEEQQERLLPLFTGERFHAAALAWTEPSPCFDPLALTTEAEPKGDGFVLSGIKSFVLLADQASHLLVLARNTSSTEDGAGALEAFIVPRDAKGLTVSEPEKNLGLKAVPTFTVEFDRVDVTAADRLGGGDGIDAARLLASCRTAIASLQVGLCRAVLDYAIPYAKDREAFDEAIAKKQAIAFMLSDMAVEIDSTRWLVWKAASQLENGLDATKAAWMAWSYAGEATMKITDNGLQVLGGHGFIREHPVEMWYRNARTLSILEAAAAV